MKRLIRNSAFGMIASVTTTLGNFASGLIVARTLGVEGAGVVAYGIWLATMAVTLTSAGVPFTLGRYLPELTSKGETDEAARLNAYLLKPYLLFALVPPALMLIYALTVTPGSGRFDAGFNLPLWILVASVALTQSAADFARGYLRGMQKFDTIAKASFVAALAQPLVTILAAREFGVAGAMAGYVAGNSIPALLILSVPRPSQSVTRELRLRVLRCASYRWAAEILASFVWARMEVFFLQLSWGSGSIGLFSSGLTLANLAVQLPMMLTWGLVPHFSEQAGRKEYGRMQTDFATGTRIMAFMLLPSCFGLSAIMPELFPLLYGQEFAGAVNIAIVLVCGAGLAATTAVAGNVIWAMERTDVDFWVGLAGAAAALVADLIIIPLYGPMGAAFSRVLAQNLSSFLGVLFLVKYLRFSLPYLDLGKILIAALACALGARASLVLVPGAAGLPLAIMVGAVVYFASACLLKVLPESDIIRFRSVAGLLPKGLATQAHHILDAFATRKP
jgi:O-antigen/teichoic acid export membrane protein